MLDLGCGAGYPNAHYLTERGLKIDGVDIAPAMIEQCRSQWPGQTWRVGDMRTAPLFGPYDAALAWHSSFHLPATDQAELINRVAGALKPAAPFLFTGGPSEGVVWGEMEGEPLFHASLAPDRYDQSLEAAGLQVVARRVEDPDCGGASVWLARKR
ncbi:MAG: class I SAM-dependent methyltransferase [Pseudomonadota bacterium]